MKADSFSLWTGAIVTVLVAGLFFVYFKSVNRTGQITETASKSEEQIQTYEIKKGDTLWKIAQVKYNDGYRWREIYDANNAQILNPNRIEIGTKIVLPKLENNIKEYTVIKGDSLWKIATSQCGNGYVWSSIARQNNLVNPSIIHSGNVLKFRCDGG